MSLRFVAMSVVAGTALLGTATFAVTRADNGRNSPVTRQSSTTPPVPELEPPLRYVVPPTEVAPQLKQAAADFVMSLTSYKASAEPAQALVERFPGFADMPGLLAAGRPMLVRNATSAGDVIYPQLGGLANDRASVMVVVRQRLLVDRSRHNIVRTLDVRLARDPRGWSVTGLEPLLDELRNDTDAPLSAEATGVLNNTNIDLPDTAREDVRRGRVDMRLLVLLVDIAREHRVRVTVFAAGHPRNVFGREKVSNHTEGRAVDIWSVDGAPVIDSRQRGGPLATFARSLLQKGATELGAPWDLDGSGNAAFADTVHQDHLHIGFDM